MDDRRFDDLTKRMAHGVSRRTAVKGGVAALLGAFGLRGHAAAQVTQAQCGNVSCKNNPGKCKPGCVCCVEGNGNSRCRPQGTCSPGQEIPPTTTSTTTAAPSVVVLTGELTESDPIITQNCKVGDHYDAYVFTYAGGPLSLAARGAASGGGTLPDPVIQVLAGTGVPAEGSCPPEFAFDDDSGCGFDAYLELADGVLAPGTYTAVVSDVTFALGTYTFERNTFGGGACP